MASVHRELRSRNSIYTPTRKIAVNRLVHSKCGIERVKQGRLAERLEQAVHGTLLEQAWTDGFVFVSGDEHDRNLLPAMLQFLLQIAPVHARHGDVEDQALGFV